MNTGRIIAMWSGPRNISTAMMRSWGNRSDTRVVDEPFYAHFLQATGLDHPLAEDIIAAGQTDWRRVVEKLVIPPDSGIFYQKHITTHWLEDFDTSWLDALEHVFLIREPEYVVSSYVAKRGSATPADLGYAQQAALFDQISAQRGTPPPVIDGTRFLNDPEDQLRCVCERLEIPFEAAMLAWPAGPRPTDGLWGQHWYDAVNRSTGFGAPRKALPQDISEAGRRVADTCRPYYEALKAYAL